MTAVDTPHCKLCDDVLGAYEPLVAMVSGRPLRGNRRAIREGEPDGGECYHEACFAALRQHRGTT